MGIRDMVSTGRYRTPMQLVPTETVVSDPEGRFTFEIPWPWFEWKRGLDEDSSPQSDRIVLLAPRSTDPWPEASIWTTEDSFNSDDKTLKNEARRLAHTLGGKAHRPRRLLVGGVPAIDFFVECVDTVTHQLVMASAEVTTLAVFRLPHREAPGYEVHVETMLATWHWI